MSHTQLRRESNSNHSGKMHRMLGGHVDAADKRSDEKMIREGITQHENQEHGGKHSTIKFRAKGGKVDDWGDKPAMERSDRPGRARGGANKKKHGNTHVNVIVAPGAGGGPPPPPGLPPGLPPGGPPPMMPPHPPMPMPAPGGGAPGGMAGGPPIGAMAPRPMPMPMPMPPGGPPGIHNTGGRVARANGGALKGRDAEANTTDADGPSFTNVGKPAALTKSKFERADGGKVPYPIDDGAASGEGRLEKKAAYGKMSDKGEGK